LTPEDVAEAVVWSAGQPAPVTVAELVVLASAWIVVFLAGAYLAHRRRDL
jgi:hypothetical protein